MVSHVNERLEKQENSMKAIQDRLVEVELKAKEAAVSEKADSMHPDRLQAKLNSWVEKLET